MGQFIDRSGRRYGRLIVLRRDDQTGPASGGQRVVWICQCDCGNLKRATGHELSAGDTTSCGCFHREVVGRQRRTHARSRTPTYRSWQAAKSRCEDPKNEKFAAYGGRGIKMCERWRESFAAFLADMGERPAGMTIDRVDNDGDYEPQNCRWATPRTQLVNRPGFRLYDWRGRRMTSTEVAEVERIPASSLRARLKLREPIDQAVAYVQANHRSR
jgi:hypothetical protein